MPRTILRPAAPRAGRPPSRLAALLACLTLALGHGCAVNPVSGRNEVVLMSEETEQELGDQAAQQVAAQLGLHSDPALGSYVRALGNKLAEGSPRPDVEYSFYVVDLDEPNAFALPGGYVYVSRGLLALANSESEVANVIGHEIGHIAARHAVQRDAAQKIATVATVLAVVGAAAAGDGAAAAASQLLGAGILASYSRDQERQSDRIAQDLTADIGIDPGGMATFLRTLDHYTRLKTGASRVPGFFDSHPATPERFAEATSRAEVVRWEPGFAIASTREEYLRKIDGMVVGPAAAQGVFRGDTFLHADLGIALRFPRGWRRENTAARVIAASPSSDAIALLEMQGSGTDPRAAAVEYAQRQGVRLSETQPLTLGGYPAFRARSLAQTPAGMIDSLITWVAKDGLILRLSAGSQRGLFYKYEGIFRSFTRGIRPLREQDMAGISELRLRLARIQPGESLAQFSARSGNAWNLNEMAVANGILDRDRVRPGQLLKIARREPYRPEPRTPADPEAKEAGGPPAGERPRPAPLPGPAPPPLGG